MVFRAFVVKFTKKKLVMGLFSSEDRMIVVWVILIQHQRVTEGRTYGFTIAHTASCWGAVKSITYVTTSVQVTRYL